MKRQIMAIAIVSLCLFLMAGLSEAANSPYTVYGMIRVNGFGTNGLPVTIYNQNTQETMSYADYPDELITYTGVNGPGYYSADLGNMEIQWSVGDVIYVNATFQDQTTSEHFTIPYIPEFHGEGQGFFYIFDLGFSVLYPSGGGGTSGEGSGVQTGMSPVVVVFLVILIIIGLFVVFKPIKKTRK